MKLNFRKATSADIDAIVGIYTRIHDAEEAGLTSIGWIRSIYPTRDTAIAALNRDDLFVCEATKASSPDSEYPEKSNIHNIPEYSEKFNIQKNSKIESGQILATAIINQIQVDVYDDVEWEYSAPDDKVSVLHTLGVDPELRFGGIGKAFVHYWEQFAAEQGCTELRMDTNARNSIARKFYSKLGYKEVGIVSTVFNGIPGVNLVMLEKPILKSK